MKFSEIVKAMDEFLEVDEENSDRNCVVVRLTRISTQAVVKFPFLRKDYVAFNVRKIGVTTLFSIIFENGTVDTVSWSENSGTFSASEEERHRVILSFIKEKTGYDFYNGYNFNLTLKQEI